jgi:diaminopimelate decarboxylase
VGVWVRVSPNVDAHTHAYDTTGLLDSKFGFPLATGAAQRALEAVQRADHLQFKGLHAHIGSQVRSATPFLETVDALLDLAASARAIGLATEELSPGGGLGIAYEPGERNLPIADVVREIAARVEAGCMRRQLPLPRLVLEPGRSIIGQAGVALYTVGGVKEIPGVRTYVSVDGGMSDNPRPALYGATYWGLLANRASEPRGEPVTVAGKLCESGDVLIRDLPLPPPHPGDLLAVPASGAYQLAMSSNYNQALRPAAVLVAGGAARLIQRRETYADLVRRDLPLDGGKDVGARAG